MPKLSPTDHTWLLYAAGSAVFAAVTALLTKLGVAPDNVTAINSNLATFIRTAVVLVVSAALISLRGEWQWPEKVSSRAIWMLALSGVATGLSWLCYFRALQLAPASRVAPIDKLSVVLVVILGVALLGEPLSLKLALGTLLIGIGVVVIATI